MMKRRLAAEAIRLLAASQAVGMVFVHAAWLLLLAAVWGYHREGGGVDDFGTRLLRSYAWLGGIGPDGHGDESGMLVVWGKLSLVVYGAAAVLRALRGERAAIALWRWALGSGAVAFAGALFALWPEGLDGEAFAVAAGFGVFALLATFWGVGARRLGEALARGIESGGANKRAAAQSTG